MESPTQHDPHDPPDEQVLARIDLEGVRPARLWHRYSDGRLEAERFADWRDPFYHPRWAAGTDWAVVPDERDDARRYLLTRVGDRMLLAGDRHWRDLTVRAEVRQFFPFNVQPSVNLAYRPDCLSGLVLRVRDVRSYYLYCLENYDRVSLYRVEDDQLVALRQEHVPLDNQRFHRMEATCRGDRIACRLDGVELFSAQDGAYPAGWCGLRANSKAGFREVAVVADGPARAANLELRAARARALDALREQYPQPVLERQIPRPAPGPGALQLRRVDAGDAWGFFWLEQPAGAPERVHAADMEGQVLWTTPLEHAAAARPGSTGPKAYDIDHDGHDELLVSDGESIKILSGKTGQVLAARPFPEAAPLMGVPGTTAPIGYSYAVQFRPPPAPMDILLLDADPGGGRNVWCYDAGLELRWQKTLPFAFGHNMCFPDIDGDGAQEAMIGHCLLDGDGNLLWSIEAMHTMPCGAMGIHADSVVVGDLAGDGRLRLASVSGDDGVLFVDALTGRLLNRERLGHAQGVSAARYLSSEPGIQVLVGTRHRAYGIFGLYNGHGERLFRWQPDFVSQGGRPVNWRGDGEELLLLGSPESGQGLFDAYGRLVVPFDGDLGQVGAGAVVPHPFDFDGRDRLLAVGPERIAFFAPGRPLPAEQREVYWPARDYWRGSTIGVISHPRWVPRG